MVGVAELPVENTLVLYVNARLRGRRGQSQVFRDGRVEMRHRVGHSELAHRRRFMVHGRRRGHQSHFMIIPGRWGQDLRTERVNPKQ
ncbi:MAG: hypothetical protein DMG83_04825 [Acidobacteria bacterium]|nr:MAG: hypothetical protein DMG83_04825 [Acidobacteriota bacterium]